jgi:hypothetical protein
MKYRVRPRSTFAAVAAAAIGLAAVSSGCHAWVSAGDHELSLSLPPEKEAPPPVPQPQAGSDKVSAVYLDMG